MRTKKEILHTGMEILFQERKKLNWSKVMDGTTATTQWMGLHDVLETVHSYNPENGYKIATRHRIL
jgi:acyl-homoserine lactone acylase PvdQ